MRVIVSSTKALDVLKPFVAAALVHLVVQGKRLLYPLVRDSLIGPVAKIQTKRESLKLEFMEVLVITILQRAIYAVGRAGETFGPVKIAPKSVACLSPR